MRHSIAIFIVIFVFYSCHLQDSSVNDGQGDLVKPKIKSCKIYSYDQTNENLDEGILMEEFEYNEDGFETKLVRYDTTGEIICSFSYKYDQSGNLTEKIWMEARNNEVDNSESVDLSFDNDREVITLTGEGSDKIKYDKSGKLIERVWNDPTNEIGIKETHHYYKDGREVEIVYYNELNKIEKKTVHVYDSLGNETSMITYNKDEEMLDKLTYTYDEYGNIKEDIYWDIQSDKPVQIVKYVYEFY